MSALSETDSLAADLADGFVDITPKSETSPSEDEDEDEDESFDLMCKPGSLLKKLVPVEKDRKLFGAMVVVAANAGGVWTPIGDVTTTMLWMNNQLSTIPTVTELFYHRLYVSLDLWRSW